MYKKAYRLFETKQPFQVALELGISQPEASKYYLEYRILKGLDDLSWFYHTLGHKNITELKSLHRALVRNGVSPNLYPPTSGRPPELIISNRKTKNLVNKIRRSGRRISI